ncbi:ECF transporter S component [Actinobacteria bacterium YIM 96077]|uniref:ECF transporter S component n=1 Tax=Phytoactinopolyspora halophila TaxID=1981511 RepID=A0A329QFM0_9ACTN|nr:ECF transporter S component [Phytoactinopolyspora halophila]AYY13692.1 ECF transporter S component [Actinobacteria bacterium YIM 96077]RAW11255.1 ECF transporter S component [Phytoactinopolyspora halophila]
MRTTSVHDHRGEGDGGGRHVGAVAMPLGPRSATAVALVSILGVVAFTWPLYIDADAALARSSDAPWLFAALLPLLLLIVLAQLAEGTMDAKSVALLGVLSAVGTGLRVLGGGGGGIEPVFFLFVLAGRALGPGFGFVLGQLTLLTSALITGGVGPWLPFQMLAASWIALFAGMLPPLRGRAEIWMLAAYGALSGLVYGLLINMWFWPFLAHTGSDISFVPGDPLSDNAARYLGFVLATSLGWDLMRAVFTTVLCLVAGSTVLTSLRRAARRARFDLR